MIKKLITLNDSGLREVFFDFVFASDHQKVYEVPDFLIDVRKTSEDTKKYLVRDPWPVG